MEGNAMGKSETVGNLLAEKLCVALVAALIILTGGYTTPISVEQKEILEWKIQ